MNQRTNPSRRAFLASSAVVGTAGLAGCTGLIGSDEDGSDSIGQIGSGRGDRPEPGGTSIEDLPDLEGSLHVYSGRNEFLIGPLVSELENHYENFELDVRYDDSSDLVNQISEAGDATEADVFYTVDAGALGALADEGLTRAIPDETADLAPGDFQAENWIGTSGRARTVPYNTDAYDEGELPDSIMDYAEFDGDLGWAPSYASCQSFVAVMRQLEGDEATRQWLEGVVDSGISDYNDEQAVCNAVNDGEIDAGFTNHYYIQRVIDGSSDPSIGATFTEGDAGAVFNVAGATVTNAADDPDLAENFVRHLLSSEAQEYFAVETFEYPMIDGVDPYGDLPSIDELNVPDVDLSELSNVEETVDFMRDVDGINI